MNERMGCVTKMYTNDFSSLLVSISLELLVIEWATRGCSTIQYGLKIINVHKANA